jgi:hypothetical protein
VIDAPLWLLIVSLSIVAGALAMTLVNLRLFRATARDLAPAGEPPAWPSLSVCIPARNEEANLEACVRSVLAGGYPSLSVLVYDDQSTDGTPEVLARLAREDARVRRVETRPLPAGWVGKQWACWQLGQAAASEYVLFIDADVRLSPDCLRRAVGEAQRGSVDLLSTFPKQITLTLGERLLVPLIHFILLSYLPFARMRNSNDPSASAACGQFILMRRAAYERIGGHGACRDSMHDGVKLPRAVRRAGMKSDLFDGTDVCSCRMYRGLVNTWRGFAKNAFEGLGSVGLLAFITVLHAVGHVLPWVVLAALAVQGRLASAEGAVAGAAVVLTLIQRLVLASRFEQSLLSAALHPLGVTMMTLVQWHSYALALTGRRGWKGRTLGTPSAPGSAASSPGAVA